MVRDSITSTKWYWGLDPWRTEFNQLRLRVENGRWTDITLRDGGILGRDHHGMRLDEEYPELYTEFTFPMLSSEYLARADEINYMLTEGVEPEHAFAPPTSQEIARSRGYLSDKTITRIQKWWKRGVAVIALGIAVLLFKDAPWDEFIAWYMEHFGAGMAPPA